MRSRFVYGLILKAMWIAFAWAGEPEWPPIMGSNELVHLERALHNLNMTRVDLGFAKDVGKPRWALSWIRRLLAEPLGLSGEADALLAAVGPLDGETLRTWIGRALELPVCPPYAPSDKVLLLQPGLLPARLRKSVEGFCAKAVAACGLIQEACVALSPEERREAAVGFLAETFMAEDDPDVRRLLEHRYGVERVQRAIRESQVVDPEPAAQRVLAFRERIRLEYLLAAAGQLHATARAVQADAHALTEWPAHPLRIPTELGDVWVGSTNADLYTQPALLILEPGGNDRYTESAGAADGLAGQGLAVVVDLGGDDTYARTDPCGTATALFGVAVVIEVNGNDTYRSRWMGQGSGILGVGWLQDEAGNDFYQARAMGQGAGYMGIGILQDITGNDTYDIGLMGQGFAGVYGIGLLCDHAGNDRYHAGRAMPDHERHEDRYLSLAQGFSIGMRPFAGGGVGALVDLAGNDAYEADVFAQGVSYWYSVGMLLDLSGHDTYRVFHYGQGAGIHLSLGLLADGKGNDRYDGAFLVQGQAHDYGVGLLVDGDGQDTYAADECAQGQGLFNSLGILLDRAGNDTYGARQADRAQGIGHHGDTREYGSLGLLLDLDGADRYACAARDGCRLARPHVGIVYDVP